MLCAQNIICVVIGPELRMLSDILTSGANGLLIPKVAKRLCSLIVRIDILHCNMKKKTKTCFTDTQEENISYSSRLKLLILKHICSAEGFKRLHRNVKCFQSSFQTFVMQESPKCKLP